MFSCNVMHNLMPARDFSDWLLSLNEAVFKCHVIGPSKGDLIFK